MSIRPLSVKQVDEPQIADELELLPEARKLPSPSSSRHTVTSSSSIPGKKSLRRFFFSISPNLRSIGKATSENKQAPRPVVSRTPSLSGLKTQSPIPSSEEQRVPSPPHSNSSPSYPSSPHSSFNSPYKTKLPHVYAPSSRIPSPKDWQSSSNQSPIRNLGLPKSQDSATSPTLRRMFKPYVLRKMLEPQLHIKQPVCNTIEPSSPSPQNKHTKALLVKNLSRIVVWQHKYLEILRSIIDDLNMNFNDYSNEIIMSLRQQIIKKGREILQLHEFFNANLEPQKNKRILLDDTDISYYVNNERKLLKEVFFTTVTFLDNELKDILSYKNDPNIYFSNLADMTDTILWAQNTDCLNEIDKPASIKYIFDNIQYFVQLITLNYPRHEHFELKKRLKNTVEPLFEGSEEMLTKLNAMIFLT